MKAFYRMIYRVTLSAWLVTLAGCGLLDDGEPEDIREITITMIAKSESNPVFLSARLGAESAAKDLSEKSSKYDVKIDWRTPQAEDAEAQAQNIIDAVNSGTDAILISCSNEKTLEPVINQAVDSGVPVMTFDSDAPDSRRFSYYGADDYEMGGKLMSEMATLLDNKGSIAILAGNRHTRNLQQRVKGVLEAAANYPNINIIGVYQHGETADVAAAEVLRVNAAHPEISGWVMVGGWALFTDSLMDRIDPNKIKIVAVDALPSQLPYVEKGVVPVLLAQPTYRWGKVSVEKIIDRIYYEKDVDKINKMKLIRVSRENLGGWARQLKAWGYDGVPEYYLTYVADD